MKWMIYGANGSIGELLAREAVYHGMSPILSGRNTKEVSKLADSLGLEARQFYIHDHVDSIVLLNDIDIVLNCADLSSQTTIIFIESAMRSLTHYLDISGKYDVFEYAFASHEKASQVGVAICPGVGFSNLPTDCLAAMLKSEMPDATQLNLGFDSPSSLPPRLLARVFEGASLGGTIRQGEQIVQVPNAHKVRMIDFGEGVKQGVSITWGDISSAYYTSGIPNIEFFLAITNYGISAAKLSNFVLPLVRVKNVQRSMNKLIRFAKRKAFFCQHKNTSVRIWGEACNKIGSIESVSVEIENVTKFTVESALSAVRHLLEKQSINGFYTPSRLLGSGVINRLQHSSEVVFQ